LPTAFPLSSALPAEEILTWLSGAEIYEKRAALVNITHFAYQV
jgi:hypothetical protein